MLDEVLNRFTSDPTEQRRLRRRMKKMFGEKLKRRPDQTVAGWRETLILMAKCALGGDGELRSALGVKQMTVFPVLDVWYWKPKVVEKPKSSHSTTHMCKTPVSSDGSGGGMEVPPEVRAP